MLITRRIFRKLIFEALLLEMSVTDIKTAYPILNDPVYSKYLAMIRNQKYVTFLDKMLNQMLGPAEEREEIVEHHFGEVIFMVLMHEKYAGNQIPLEYRDLNNLNFQKDRRSQRLGLVELIDDLDFKHMSKNQTAYVELTNKDKALTREVQEKRAIASGQPVASAPLGTEVAPDLYLVDNVNGWDILRPESVVGAKQIGVRTWCTVYSNAWNLYADAGQTLYYVAKPQNDYGHQYNEDECEDDGGKVLNNYFALTVDDNGRVILDGGSGGPSVWPDQNEVSRSNVDKYIDNPADLDAIINAIESHYAAAGGVTPSADYDEDDGTPPVDRQEMKRLRAMSRNLTVFKENFRSFGSPDQRLNFVIGVLQSTNLSNEVFNHIVEKIVFTVSDSKIRESLLYTTLGPVLFKSFMIENIVFILPIHKSLPDDLLQSCAQVYFSMPHIIEIADNLSMNSQIASKINDTILQTVTLLRQTLPQEQIYLRSDRKRYDLYNLCAVGLLDADSVLMQANGGITAVRKFNDVMHWQTRQNLIKMQSYLPDTLKIKVNNNVLKKVLDTDLFTLSSDKLGAVLEKQDLVDPNYLNQFIDKVIAVIEDDPRIVDFNTEFRNAMSSWSVKGDFKEKNNLSHSEINSIENMSNIIDQCLKFDDPGVSRLLAIISKNNLKYFIKNAEGSVSVNADEQGFFYPPVSYSDFLRRAPIPINGFTGYILDKIDSRGGWNTTGWGWSAPKPRTPEGNAAILKKYKDDIPEEIRIKLSALNIFQKAFYDSAPVGHTTGNQLVANSVANSTRFAILLKFIDLHGQIYNLLNQAGFSLNGTFPRRQLYNHFEPIIRSYHGKYTIFYDVENFNKLIDLVNIHGREAYENIGNDKYNVMEMEQINTARPYSDPLDVVLNTLKTNLIDLGFYEGKIISIDRNEKLKKINEGL
jgi:mRNA-degrading endonuclease RelE of RelBE toxin-antitoxin system